MFTYYSVFSLTKSVTSEESNTAFAWANFQYEVWGCLCRRRETISLKCRPPTGLLFIPRLGWVYREPRLNNTFFSYGTTAHTWTSSSSLLRFLNYIHLDTRYESSALVISPSQRSLPTQDNTTYKHKRQTSMPRAIFEPATPATKRP
jgi:hypothetical protein